MISRIFVIALLLLATRSVLAQLNSAAAQENAKTDQEKSKYVCQPRVEMSIKDAQELLNKYVQLALLPVDTTTPEAVAKIFGIEYQLNKRESDGTISARFYSSRERPISPEVDYFYNGLTGVLLIDIEWTYWFLHANRPLPSICVNFDDLKNALVERGWKLHPALNTPGSSLTYQGLTPASDERRFGVSAALTGFGCIMRFTVSRHDLKAQE